MTQVKDKSDRLTLKSLLAENRKLMRHLVKEALTGRHTERNNHELRFEIGRNGNMHGA